MRPIMHHYTHGANTHCPDVRRGEAPRCLGHKYYEHYTLLQALRQAFLQTLCSPLFGTMVSREYVREQVDYVFTATEIHLFLVRLDHERQEVLATNFEMLTGHSLWAYAPTTPLRGQAHRKCGGVWAAKDLDPKAKEDRCTKCGEDMD